MYNGVKLFIIIKLHKHLIVEKIINFRSWFLTLCSWYIKIWILFSGALYGICEFKICGTPLLFLHTNQMQRQYSFYVYGSNWNTERVFDDVTYMLMTLYIFWWRQIFFNVIGIFMTSLSFLWRHCHFYDVTSIFKTSLVFLWRHLYFSDVMV